MMAINGHDEEVREFRLERFRVEHFRSFHDAELLVEPDITVLVGRNDVGKTSALEAMGYYGLVCEGGFRNRALPAEAQGDGAPRFTATWLHRETGERYEHAILWDAAAPQEMLRWGEHQCSWHARERRLVVDGEEYQATGLERFASLGSIARTAWRAESDVPDEASSHLAATQLFRPRPPFHLQSFGLGLLMPMDFERMEINGAGWVVRVQEIINRRDGTIEALEEHARALFPHFRRLAVKEDRWAVSVQRHWSGAAEAASDPPPAAGGAESRLLRLAEQESTRGVMVEVQSPATNGTVPGSVWVPADHVSSGLLLYLAHLTLAMSTPRGGLIAIEEPENGLDPTIVLHMMHQFLETVRERNLQLIMTTHNPFWLDLVEPRCIRVVTRDESGSHIHADPDNFQRIKDEDYYLSEIMGLGGPEELLRKRGEAS